MNTFAIGLCKQEMTIVTEPFTGIGFFKEYKAEQGESVNLYTESVYDEDATVYFYMRHKKIEISRKDIEKHFELIWKQGCYNTCIRDGVPCLRLAHVPEGSTHLTERFSWTCSIGWEVGRGDCCEYKTK
jgi:hypothetical protein